CIIGNDVWLGTGVTVLRGVRIGDGAIIGANAVVTKNIPDYCIAVGVPAKVIKRRLPVNVTEKIKETKWWNDEYEVAKDKIICLTNELKL
ncbi:TPA: DapH/DapD/GlmU-related protein, partial [Escherichia coli]